MAFAVLFICVAAAAGVVSHNFIALRDHDFVGEDPALSAELARRMSSHKRKAEQPRSPLPKKEMVAVLDRLAFFNVLHDESHKPATPITRTNVSAADTFGTNETNINNGTRRQHEMLSTPQWIAYPKDVRYRHLYGLHLKAAEQAIYSAQYRIKDMEWITKKYENDKRFRISYMLSKVSEWKSESLVLFSYSHKIGPYENNWVPLYEDGWLIWEQLNRNTPQQMNVYTHIIYYTHIFKNFIDMLYTTEYLLETHRSMQKENKERKLAISNRP